MVPVGFAETSVKNCAA